MPLKLTKAPRNYKDRLVLLQKRNRNFENLSFLDFLYELCCGTGFLRDQYLSLVKKEFRDLKIRNKGTPLTKSGKAIKSECTFIFLLYEFLEDTSERYHDLILLIHYCYLRRFHECKLEIAVNEANEVNEKNESRFLELADLNFSLNIIDDTKKYKATKGGRELKRYLKAFKRIRSVDSEQDCNSELEEYLKKFKHQDYKTNPFIEYLKQSSHKEDREDYILSCIERDYYFPVLLFNPEIFEIIEGYKIYKYSYKGNKKLSLLNNRNVDARIEKRLRTVIYNYRWRYTVQKVEFLKIACCKIYFYHHIEEFK